METLVIRTSEWQRGEGAGVLRKSVGGGKYRHCCVGIYLRDVCGVPKNDLENRCTAEALMSPMGFLHPKVPKWLVKDTSKLNGLEASKLAAWLYNANDVTKIPEKARRTRIKKHFAKAGVRVKFVDDEGVK